MSKSTEHIELINACKVLGVFPWAPIEVIDAAKKSLLKKYHPDTSAHGFEGLGEKICKSIQTAHEVIINSREKDHLDKTTFFFLLELSGGKRWLKET